MDKSQYFYRIAVFSMQEDKVSLLDANDLSAKTPPLEPWLGVVVSLADGQHTLQQLIEHLAGQYNGAPPQELDRTIESVIERLTETEVIKLAEQAVILPRRCHPHPRRGTINHFLFYTLLFPTPFSLLHFSLNIHQPLPLGLGLKYKIN